MENERICEDCKQKAEFLPLYYFIFDDKTEEKIVFLCGYCYEARSLKPGIMVLISKYSSHK